MCRCTGMGVLSGGIGLDRVRRLRSYSIMRVFFRRFFFIYFAIYQNFGRDMWFIGHVACTSAVAPILFLFLGLAVLD